MANTVYLNNGETEYCFDGSTSGKADFLERLLREKLGDDAACFFTGYVAELEDEWCFKEHEKQETEHEAIADGYLAMCRDARDQFNVILEMLEKPRMNRKELREAAQRGYDDLNNNL
ncbi:hypothetical protein [uncultured Ruminococcus sp.]|uniref:hypothetical protein n=1 Tax=uncultured Ruminococcus sp. TaxID=165186 RepID=UPI00292E3315|nr:hypothetical protein [uncultured Ruminococcus sp.]